MDSLEAHVSGQWTPVVSAFDFASNRIRDIYPAQAHHADRSIDDDRSTPLRAGEKRTSAATLRLQAYQAVYHICRNGGTELAWRKQGELFERWCRSTANELFPAGKVNFAIAPDDPTSSRQGVAPALYPFLSLRRRLGLMLRLCKALFLTLHQYDAPRADEQLSGIIRTHFLHVIDSGLELVENSVQCLAAEAQPSNGVALLVPVSEAAAIIALRELMEIAGLREQQEKLSVWLSRHLVRVAKQVSLNVMNPDAVKSPIRETSMSSDVKETTHRLHLGLSEINRFVASALHSTGSLRGIGLLTLEKCKCTYLNTAADHSFELIRSYLLAACQPAVRSFVAPAVPEDFGQLLKVFAMESSCMVTVSDWVSQTLQYDLQNTVHFGNFATASNSSGNTTSATGEESDVIPTEELLRKMIRYRACIDPAAAVSSTNAILQKALNVGLQRFLLPQWQPLLAYGLGTILHRFTLRRYTSSQAQADGTGAPSAAEENDDQVVQEAIRTVGLLNDKDLFVNYSMRFLSKRVLFATQTGSFGGDGGSSDARDTELELIGQIAKIVGRAVVAPLYTLVNSAVSFSPNEEAFAALHESNLAAAQDTVRVVEKTVMSPDDVMACVRRTTVLPTSIWHSLLEEAHAVYQVPADIAASPSHPLRHISDVLCTMYLSTYPSRALKWVMSAGSVTLRCFGSTTNVAAGTTILTLTCLPVAAIALLRAFGTSDGPVDNAVIADGTPAGGAHHVDFVIKGLCKIGLLTRGDSKSSSASYSYTPDALKSKSKQIRMIPNLLTAATSSGVGRASEAMTKALREGREKLVEACIIRILKSRRTLAHSELVCEVERQLQQRFVPTRDMMKNALASLLDREYIRREESSLQRTESSDESSAAEFNRTCSAEVLACRYIYVA